MELAKAFEPADIEHRWYPEWEAQNYFAAGVDGNKQDNFCILLPPPNVTGTLHMGHGFNQTIMDALTRYYRMKGHNTLWQPGTDHAGIATQIVVERQLDAQGVSRHDLGREKFLEKVWEWKEYSGGTITRQMRRMGTSPDWKRERFTMDAGLNKVVTETFVRLYNEGLIYRGKRLVNWDPKLHTAVSDLEVVQEEEDGFMWHINYPFSEGPIGDLQGLTVATTRPETMLGDVAVMVHPEDERYAHLIGKSVSLPLCERNIPIIADDYVDREFGTGVVKVTPAHDFNDYAVGQRHNLPQISILTLDAKINEHAPAKYQGLDRFDARKAIVADLEAAGVLVDTKPHKLQVPRGDRTGVVIEPMLTDQWFVAMSKPGADGKSITQKALDVVSSGEIQFVPGNWVNTYNQWLNNIQDWCISRQLWWGHQIPAWYGIDGECFVAHSEEEARQLADKAGYPGPLTRDPDVLDTWYSSALWPFSTLGWPEQTKELARYYPTTTLITGFDIIFFWVARMMMMGLAFMPDVPFRHVYIHGLVRDAKGAKMSKSKGNIIDPLDLIDRYGCDALRFTLALSTMPGRDIKLSESRVEGGRNFATKLWNAARYCQMNGVAGIVPVDPAAVRLTVNRWVLGELTRTTAEVSAAIEGFDFHAAASALHQFTWGTFCDWYLEFTKPILASDDEAAKAETRAVTGHVLRDLLKLLHPAMPFITEELWERMGFAGGTMLVTAKWPAPEFADAAASAELNWIVRLIGRVRALRSEYDMAPSAQVALEVIGLDAAHRDSLARNRALAERLCNATIATAETLAKAVEDVFEEARLRLAVGAVDLPKQRDKFTRLIAKAEKEVASLDGRLANPSFIAKADPEAIEDLRERRATEDAARAGYRQALERLKTL